ncbi:hypothetical protein HNQ69_001121 [Bartonella callosciuri]|uniref:BepD protein n=2 Tax=Bartonella callosciuri TaxID=686223 RepID=A0A840NUA3_9HYPH|nr:hypothetical protein [Bartonella callosciuri]
MGPDAYRLENPLYESLDTGRNEERNPELPETVYAPQNPPGNAYMRPREGENPQKLVDPYTVTDLLTPHMGPDAYRLENPLYESLDTGRNEERNPELPETVYAPQNPPGNAYMRPREGENPQKLVDPYTVTDLLTPHMGPDAYRLENPLYAGLNTGRNEERNPEPPETVYASKNPPENAYMRPRGGKNPQKLVDPYKVTDLLKPHMGPDAHHLENPLYESLDTQRNTGLNPEPQESVHKEVNLGRRTPSPETHNIAQNLLRNVDIQYGREEVRYWCGIVYGNRSALEEQFSKILENPQQGETILWDLAENPESGGQLAGRKVLGVKSPKRKEAEEGFGPLCAALERHVGTVKKLHKDLTRHHERDKKHKKEKSLEQKQQRHSHPTREQQQTAPEQNRQPSKQAPSEGRAFAL